MIRAGFLDPKSRKELTELARDRSAAHRLARRANAMVLPDDGMSCFDVATILLLDEDTVRTWHRGSGKLQLRRQCVPPERCAAGQAEGAWIRPTSARTWIDFRSNVKAPMSVPAIYDQVRLLRPGKVLGLPLPLPIVVDKTRQHRVRVDTRRPGITTAAFGHRFVVVNVMIGAGSKRRP